MRDDTPKCAETLFLTWRLKWPDYTTAPQRRINQVRIPRAQNNVSAYILDHLEKLPLIGKFPAAHLIQADDPPFER